VCVCVCMCVCVCVGICVHKMNLGNVQHLVIDEVSRCISVWVGVGACVGGCV